MKTEYGSMKELYDCFLKTTYPLEINGTHYEEGEVIARFDSIRVAGFEQISTQTRAEGGFDNRPRVFWQSTKELALSFFQGVFSKTQFALSSNSKIMNFEEDRPLLTKQEETESDENGIFITTKTPEKHMFVYGIEDGRKVNFSVVGDTQFKIAEPYKDLVVTYEYSYTEQGQTVKIGQNLIPGYLSFEGKTRVKDDNTGQIKTGIIAIPQLKLVSDLSMQLGQDVTPMGAAFRAIGVPVDSRERSYVMEFHFLNENVD